MCVNQLDPARCTGGVAEQPKPRGRVTPTRVTQDHARDGEREGRCLPYSKSTSSQLSNAMLITQICHRLRDLQGQTVPKKLFSEGHVKGQLGAFRPSPPWPNGSSSSHGTLVTALNRAHAWVGAWS